MKLLKIHDALINKYINIIKILIYIEIYYIKFEIFSINLIFIII